ncbi:MAG: hypothetical protein JSV49_07025 [Thermoplasmata archaeon]|nr:MAG: hypothetical protein JSV49_07025 [Thermoplasmata archaeon]
MDSMGFIHNIQQKLEPIGPIILPSIIKKQLQEVGATEYDLTPEQAEELIKRIEFALERFIGPDGTKMAHKMMLRELRKSAPDYFEKLEWVAK